MQYVLRVQQTSSEIEKEPRFFSTVRENVPLAGNEGCNAR